MKNIVFLDRDTFPKRISIPRPNFKNSWKDYSFTRKKDIISRIKKAHIIVTNKTQLESSTLKYANNLELIAITATGTNIIDLDYCKDKKINVCNLRDYASISVAEHVFALILSLSKQIKGLEKDIKSNIWQKRKVFALLNRKISDCYAFLRPPFDQ